MTASPEFDHYARNYDSALGQGLRCTGEDKDYFARGRVAWLGRPVRNWPGGIRRILDYGCGTGTSIPHLAGQFRPERLIGVDISSESIHQAASQFQRTDISFHLLQAQPPERSMDLVFCNGVFHHIPVDERPAALDYISRSLRPGGCLAFWENNPWNPGTRYVMSRVPFDREAIPLSAPSAHHLLRSAGFEILRTDFLFVFPRILKWLRWLESPLSKFPIGGQFLVLCRKRTAAS